MKDEEAIFSEAVEKRLPGEREAFLERACDGDGRLRRRVEALLLAHERAGAFLATPAAAGIGVESIALGAAGDCCDRQTTAVAVATGGEEQINSVVGGAYRLLEQIGEGGMGVVYLAEQQRMVRRKVALKIIKPGMDTRQVIRRLEAEWHALALMDHSGIAQVLDAGMTPSGRPFFVMELVNGVPITRYCDGQRLRPRERLELFLQVCAAVEHAHQKGVIHRDLKPSNILVSVQDGRAAPKVIDFGVAKITAAATAAAEGTMFTGVAQMVGTPLYMSPEQAGMCGLDVDTRSDVYTLGVLLYELLTGTTPFEKQRLAQATYDEIREIIRNVDPPRPSTRVGTLSREELRALAERQQADPSKLSRTVRGDLDWIVLRAMEKDRSRRYATVGELAADVRRYLNEEPVLARPPGRAYRVGKLLRRHRLAVTSTAAVLVAVLLGIAGTIAGMVRAGRERDAAVGARTEAVRQKERAEVKAREADRMAGNASAVSAILQEVLSSANPWEARQPGGYKPSEMPVREVLDAAAARLDEGWLRGQPEVESEVRATLGSAYQGLGLYKQAEAHAWRALELQTQLVAGRDDAELARRMMWVATLLNVRKSIPEAERLARDSVRMRYRLVEGDHPDMADALDALSTVLRIKGEYGEAEGYARESLGMRRRLAAVAGRGGEVPRRSNKINREATPEESVAITLMTLAQVLGRTGRDAEAIELSREALAIRRRSLPAGHPFLGVTLHGLGELLDRAGQVVEAESCYREALAIRRNYLEEEHSEVRKPLYGLVAVLRELGRYEQAEALLLEHDAKLAGEVPGGDVARLRGSLAVELAGLYDAWGARPELARQWAARVRAPLDERIGELTEQIGERSGVGGAKVYEERAMLYARVGRFREAEADYGKAIELDPGQQECWLYRGALLAYLGEEEGYERHCRAMLHRFGGSRKGSVGVERTATTCLMLPGRMGEQQQVIGGMAERVLANARGDRQRLRPSVRLLQGLVEYRCGRWDSAARWLGEGMTPANEHQAVASAAGELFLAMAQYRGGRGEEAASALVSARRRVGRLAQAAIGDISVGGLEYWVLCQVGLREAEGVVVEDEAAGGGLGPPGSLDKFQRARGGEGGGG